MRRRRLRNAVILMTLGLLAAVFAAWLVWNGNLIPNEIFINRNALRGVDVSHYQGEIRWERLEEQGIAFAYMKATEGSSHTDGRFAENWAAVGETGIPAGAYHFFSFESGGETQAAHFLETVGELPAGRAILPPAVDVEFYGGNEASPPDPQPVRAELTAFLEAVEAEYGAKPVIYTTKEAYEYFLKGYYGEYPLWIRSILGKPDGSIPWTFWQYTNRERLEGYSGTEPYIDMNVFRGDEKELTALCISGDSPELEGEDRP